jgi:ribonuclease E
MFSPTVQLRSGGYIVINQAEALVAIDVNSGRATREHHIEDTALKTNLEAAEEVARQLRMRDLAGLVVIDFIDMEDKRNNRAVERRLKECLKHDRARIQVGGISHFGLLEMSRQRIRTSVLESSTEKCPACGGTGHVRSVSSVTLQLLRSLEETLIKSATHNLIVRTRAEVAIYVLNHKRAHLRSLEERFQVTLTVISDPSVTGQVSFLIDRGEQVHTIEAAKALIAVQPDSIPFEPEEEDEPDIEEQDEDAEDPIEEPRNIAEGEPLPERVRDSGEAAPTGVHDDGTPRRKRRRRRRRGGADGPEHSREASGSGRQGQISETQESLPPDQDGENEDENVAPSGGAAASENGHPRGDTEPRRRRRGRRGGRRNRRDREGGPEFAPGNGDESAGEQPLAAVPDIAESTHIPRIQPSAVGREINDPPVSESFRPEALPIPQPEAEPPRRRSTVREPAPTFTGGSAPTAAPAPKPVPVVSSPPSEEPAPPKRGWWGKRLMGDKS